MTFGQPPDTATMSFETSRSMVWVMDSLTAGPLATSPSAGAGPPRRRVTSRGVLPDPRRAGAARGLRRSPRPAPDLPPAVRRRAGAEFDRGRSPREAM